MENEKKYLKTIEEVSDALAAGKVVYNKFKTSFRKDKNKFIVKTFSAGTEILNSSLAFDENRFYVLEPKPLQVKLWHLYEDREGNKFLIFKKEGNFFSGGFPGRCSRPFFDNGKWAGIDNNSFDLVKEIADLSQYFKK